MDRIYLNDNWTFYKKDEPKLKESVRLPHTNTVLPFNYLDERDYQFVSVYEKLFMLPKEAENKLVFLTFEGAAHKAEVYVNGKLVTTHNNGYTAFSVEISKFSKFGEFNEIKVILDSRESLNIPPFGHVIDYLTYGGLYREAYIDIKDKAYIEDVFVKTTSCLKDEKTLQFEVTCNTAEGYNLKDSEFEIKVYDSKNKLVSKTKKCDALRNFSVELKSTDLKLWSVDNPVMYRAEATLKVDGMSDKYVTRFGVRFAEFKADGFYLNGKKLKIRGLNRHQAYPYVGYAMPQSMQENDARVLKHELGLNAVRTSHYPQSKYFLDACDDLGLLVFTESPGWQHIGNMEWKEQHLKNVEEMVRQYRNHPSIILWGVRVNESQDDEWLYTRANDIAHKLDPTRSTSGVRYLQFSQMLEDVYSFNDFSHTGNNAGLQKKALVTPKFTKPYIVSEFNGHMFPTKAYDDERHRLSHALRHANVLNAMYAENNGISGCFGWCMADYNTHKDFGSGDKICYHGVLDMYRNPKLAAAVYASQSDEKPVLTVSSTMDIGEHPAGSIGDVYVFTNADSVSLFKNGEFVKNFRPDTKDYANLPHPPIKIDDLIGCLLVENEGLSEKSSESVKKAVHGYMCDGFSGVLKPSIIAGLGTALLRDKITIDKGFDIFNKYVGNWGSDMTVYRFDAMKNGKVIKSITMSPVTEVKLEATPTTTTLVEGTTYDVAKVNLKAISNNGNVLTYFNEAVCLETEGDIELIGPSMISLRGGMAGTYVKSCGKAGTGRLLIATERNETIEIEFKVVNK